MTFNLEVELDEKRNQHSTLLLAYPNFPNLPHHVEGRLRTSLSGGGGLRWRRLATLLDRRAGTPLSLG